MDKNGAIRSRDFEQDGVKVVIEVVPTYYAENEQMFSVEIWKQEGEAEAELVWAADFIEDEPEDSLHEFEKMCDDPFAYV